MTLIGLGGYLTAGKDEVAGHLAREHDFVLMGMSDALNTALQRIGPQGPWVKVDNTLIIDKPWTKHLRRGRYHAGEFVRYEELLRAVGYVAAKENSRDVREYLQGLGTEVGRDMIDRDVWVNIAKKKILANESAGLKTVITAIRFPNELDMLRELGGYSVWVDRESARAKAQSIAHASENSVSIEDFDYVLDNNSDLDALYSETDRFLDEIWEHVAWEDERKDIYHHQGGLYADYGY